MTNDARRKYQSIIDLPHPVSEHHLLLGRESYAAQFSPFAALTGYEDVVAESARTTEAKAELDDDAKQRLSEKLAVVLGHLNERPAVAITYFQPDGLKAGGAYVTAEGAVKKFDRFARVVYMTDGTRIPLDDISEIRGDVINAYLPDEI